MLMTVVKVKYYINGFRTTRKHFIKRIGQQTRKAYPIENSIGSALDAIMAPTMISRRINALEMVELAGVRFNIVSVIRQVSVK